MTTSKQARAAAAKSTRQRAHATKDLYRIAPPPKTARTHLAALVAALDNGDAPTIHRACEAARAFLETKT